MIENKTIYPQPHGIVKVVKPIASTPSYRLNSFKTMLTLKYNSIENLHQMVNIISDMINKRQYFIHIYPES